MPDPFMPNTFTNNVSKQGVFAPTPAPVQTPKSHKGILLSMFIIIILIIAGCATAYAYIQKIGPFAPSTYSESSFLSSLLQKVAKIDSASYSLSGSLAVEPRDADATPFVFKISNEQELKKKYAYDSQRLVDASAIINRLNSIHTSYKGNKIITKPFPQNIDNLFTDTKSDSYYTSKNASTSDPETHLPYLYSMTNKGNSFTLSVNFTTDDAIKNVKTYSESYGATTTSTSTMFEGNQVTFTKDSLLYTYGSIEPPKPLLVQLSDSLKFLPPDINVSFSIGATSQTNVNSTTSDWLFNLNAEGKFGDASYKVNADALKKDKNYFVKVNNIPSIFPFSELANNKGKWIDISTQVASSTDVNNDSFSTLKSLRDNLPETEMTYKENKAKAIKFIKKVTEIADAQGLIGFRNVPKTENIDGKILIKYDLSIHKDKILPYYNALKESIKNDPDFSEFKDFVDQGLVDYLQSDEFNQVFDYFDKNDQIVLWTDTDGFPAIVEQSIRIVPPDTATQLASKQIKIIFRFTLANINKEIKIEAPTESIPVEKIISDMNKNNNATSDDNSMVPQE